MLKKARTTMMQAFLIVVAAASLALGTNAVRSDGIPIIAEIEYDIFAPCKDTEVTSEAADMNDLTGANEDAVLYIDARPEEAFVKEHIENAINIPYSVLFGASDEDVDKVRKIAKTKNSKTIIVYGIYDDPSTPGEKVDFAESLAKQLVESEVPGVKHLEGGMEKLKKSNVKTVKETEVTK